MQGSLCQWGHIPIGQPDLETNIFSYKIKSHQYWIQYYTNRNTFQYFPFKECQQIQQKEEKKPKWFRSAPPGYMMGPDKVVSIRKDARIKSFLSLRSMRKRRIRR